MADPKHNRTPLTLLLISGSLDRIHAALMLGATAAATGRPTSFFFTKTAALFLSPARETLQSDAGQPFGEYNAALMAKNVADTGVLLDGLAALNARFLVCETALAEHALDPATLAQRPSLEITGMAAVLANGAGGDFITF